MNNRRKIRIQQIACGLLALTLLSGCASHKLGPQAVFVSPEDKQNPPLEISAAFREDLCSPNVAYVAVSVRNPHDEWQTLRNVQLNHPYAEHYDEDTFGVLSGRELIAWADALELQAIRYQHNARLAKVAVNSVTRLMMNSDDRKVQAIGATIAIADTAHRVSQQVAQSAREASMPVGDNSNHLYADELIIPPKMDRVFWITLKASRDAPLMSWLSAEYEDQHGQRHQFMAGLDNWDECSWQEDRRLTLRNWGLDNNLIPTRLNADGSKEVLRYDTTQLERQYQQAQEKLSAN